MAATQGTNILVEIAPVATAETAEPATGFVSLTGQTTGFAISGDRQDTEPEFGEADSLWAKPGAVVGRGWTVPFTAYWKDTDAAFLMVESSVMRKDRAGAAASEYLYIRIYPKGKVVGATYYRGVVTVDDFSHDFNRTGTLDTSFGFTGYGEPIIAVYAAP
jgi:hypothetical protein